MANKKQWVVGIDYSMSCPAVTIANTHPAFSFANCRTHYLSEKLPKQALPNVIGSRLGDYDGNEQRFDLISNWAILSILSITGPHPEEIQVFIEDYSFGSKGKVFHIAENAGLLKHKLYKNGISITTVPPTVIKQFATKKGNADKQKMYAAFLAETGIDLMPLYQPKAASVGSPVGDIVDSYYIAKYGYERA